MVRYISKDSIPVELLLKFISGIGHKLEQSAITIFESLKILLINKI